MTRLLLVASLLVAAAAQAAPPGAGYHANVRVSAPTRLDWTFALATQSRPKEIAGYDATKQSYELFVPARANPRALLPAVVFLSPGDGPAGWKAFERLAKARGVLFASPRGAGNGCPPDRRVRIVLDVLGDLRRHYPLDPDRTYVGGFSGGGRIACAVGFAFPELFGGVLPVCAGGALRPESWLRQRAADRLSVALLTGETDFNRGEVERLRGPYLRGVGVRTRVWTQKGLGHAIPDEKVIAEAFAWLEEGLPARQKFAKHYPASRLPAPGDGSREAMAKALLAEGRKRMAEKGQLYPGLMLVKGVMERWPDLAEAKAARKILEEQEGKDRSWEADDLAEQRRFLLAEARALDGYASGPLPAPYQKQRKKMLERARELWKQIASDQPDTPAGTEAEKRIGAIRKLLDE